MRDLQLALLSLSITIATTILGYFFQENVWNVVEIVFLENILLLCIQIYLRQRDEDSIISEPISLIRDSKTLWSPAIGLLKAIAHADVHNNDFFSKQLHDFLVDAKRTVENINEGILKIDLRPGGLFFREAEAPQNATTSFWATSYVDPGPYWRSSVGTRLLAKSKRKAKENVAVSRIFIEQASNLSSISDIVALNHDAGVNTKVIEAEMLDPRLRRDFAIVDGGKLAVELVLGEKREPIEVRYYSPDSEVGKKAIAELLSVWHQLDDLSQQHIAPSNSTARTKTH